MNQTTIAISKETKKALDPYRAKLSAQLDMRVSYSYTIKYLIENKPTEYERGI